MMEFSLKQKCIDRAIVLSNSEDAKCMYSTFKAVVGIMGTGR